MRNGLGLVLRLPVCFANGLPFGPWQQSRLVGVVEKSVAIAELARGNARAECRWRKVVGHGRKHLLDLFLAIAAHGNDQGPQLATMRRSFWCGGHGSRTTVDAAEMQRQRQERMLSFGLLA